MSLVFATGFIFLLSLFFLTIGIKIFTSKKPINMSAKVFFIFLVFTFGYQLIGALSMVLKGETTGLIIVAMYASILLLFWIQMQGYIFIGIKEKSFGDALRFGLDRLKLDYKESLGGIEIPSKNVAIQVSIQDWMDTAQIKLKGDKNPGLLKNISKAIDVYNQQNDVKANYLIAGFYLFLGSAFVVLTGWMLTLQFK